MVPTKENISHKLKTIFGYDTFRPLQEDIVTRVLEGKDCLVVMPTGGGKSICYQVPALIFPGVTIVVSPLISLMEDQVSQLKQLGVRAAVLNSSLDLQEYYEVLSDVDGGDVDVLYVAPETLLKPNILDRLSGIEVSCLAIDEAHCVSEWGHDFRPEYRQLAQVRNKLGSPVYIALTATATERVQGDIVKNLKLQKPGIFLASFDRKNLKLKVESKQKNSKSQMLQIISKFKDQSGIIYCFSRKKTDSIYQALKEEGYSVLPYHAGLSSEDRKKNQDAFIKDKVQIMVATIAFGMGINKSNVRFVIHADLPKNIESYYQEIGRAGRDSIDSECILLFSHGDRQKIAFFIEQKPNEKEKKLAYQQLDGMLNYAEATTCRRIPLLKYFAEDHAGNCGKCDNCLEPPEMADLTEMAQKFLSCVYRTGQNFGVNYIIDVLRGSKSAKILQNRHDEVSTYGIGSDLSVDQWKHLSRQLLNAQLAFSDPDRYGVLTITTEGASLLKGKRAFNGIMPVKSSSVQKGRSADLKAPVDDDLFERLRTKRRELAEAAGLPPYVVFSDKTLSDMTLIRPENYEQMLMVHGVGEKKLEKYGKIFLEVIASYQAS